MNSWSSRAKALLIVSSLLAVGSGVAMANYLSNQPKKEVPVVRGESTENEPKTEVKTETTTEEILFETTNIDDSYLAKGKTEVRTEGVNGVKTKTWDVTYTNDKETNRVLVNEDITTQPITKIIARGTKVAPPPNCNPNYSGCVPNASDVDCAGGSGNGPAYVSGPLRVIGSDIYDLDRDNDGIACE